MKCLHAHTEGIEIHVKVVPGASRDRIAGLLGDDLKVQVSAPPEKGKANDAVARLLAKTIGVSVKNVTLVSGPSSPHKIFRVKSCDLEGVAQKLGL